MRATRSDKKTDKKQVLIMKESLKKMACREARKSFTSLAERPTDSSDDSSRDAVRQHVGGCARCAAEYRLVSLQRTVLDLAAAPAPMAPDQDFFVALRARIARGPESLAVPAASGDEFWTNALWATARQLIPAMAMLLLLILGATFMWSNSAPNQDPSLEAQYGVRGMTADDMLDSLVAEERLNGR